jgi:hypothetical protein
VSPDRHFEIKPDIVLLVDIMPHRLAQIVTALSVRSRKSHGWPKAQSPFHPSTSMNATTRSSYSMQSPTWSSRYLSKYCILPVRIPTPRAKRRFIALSWLYDVDTLDANAHPEPRGELRWSDSAINRTPRNHEAFHFEQVFRF